MIIELILERALALIEQLFIELLVLAILALLGWVARTWIEHPLPPLNTPERTMEKAKGMLEGWYTVKNDGEIVFHPPPGAELDSHLPHFRKALLYIFAARDAYDMERRENAESDPPRTHRTGDLL